MVRVKFLRRIGARLVRERPRGVVSTVSRFIVSRRPSVTVTEIAPTKLPAPNRTESTPATGSSGGGGSGAGSGGIGFTGTVDVIEGNKLVATQIVVEGETVAQFKPGENKFTVNPNLDREVKLTFDRGVTRDTLSVSPTQLKGDSKIIPVDEREPVIVPEDKKVKRKPTLREDLKRLREAKKAGEITGLQFVVGAVREIKEAEKEVPKEIKRIVQTKAEKAREERIQFLEAGGVIGGLPSAVITETGERRTFPSTVVRGATDEEIKNVLENPTFPGLVDRQAAAEIFIIRTAKRIATEEKGKAQTEFNIFNSNLQSQLNEGKIDLNTAVRRSEAQLEKVNEEIVKKVEDRTDKETKPLLNKSKLVQLPNVFASGLALGFGAGALILRAPKAVQTAAQVVGGTIAITEAAKLGADLAAGRAGLLDAATFTIGFVGFALGAKASSDIFEGIARAGRRSTARTRTSKLKNETLKVEFKTSNLKQTGIDLAGKPIFEANIEVTIRTINRKTGRTIETAKVNIDQIITGQTTPEGATKFVSQGLAATLRRAGFKKFLTEPKVTLSRDLKAAVTEATFEVADAPFEVIGEPILRGRAKTGIVDIGVDKLKVTPGLIEFRVIKAKAKPTGIAFADILVKEIARKPVIKDFGKQTKIPGFEIVDIAKIKSEFTRETLKVRQADRRLIKVKGIGTEFLVDTGVTQRIQPFTRRFPKQQIPTKDFTFEIGKTFFQEGTTILDLTGLEFKPPKLPKVPTVKVPKEPKIPEFKFGDLFVEPPKLPKKVSIQQQQNVFEQTFKQQQQAARATSQAQAKAFVDTIGKELLIKPKALPKMVGGQGLTQKQVQTVFGVQVGRMKMDLFKVSKTDVSLLSGFKQPTINVKQISQQKTIPITKQASTQLQSLNTLNLLLAPTFTGRGTGFTDITKITKPVKTQITKQEKERRMEEAKQRELFDVWIKSQKRRIKVADNVSRQESLDIGSFIVDNSLSAEFKRKGSQKGKKKVPEIFAPPANWNLSSQKFRTYKLKKGKQIPLMNTFIERKQHRLDTPGEVAQITGARFFSQQRRKTSNILSTNKKVQNILGF